MYSSYARKDRHHLCLMCGADLDFGSHYSNCDYNNKENLSLKRKFSASYLRGLEESILSRNSRKDKVSI